MLALTCAPSLNITVAALKAARLNKEHKLNLKFSLQNCIPGKVVMLQCENTAKRLGGEQQSSNECTPKLNDEARQR